MNDNIVVYENGIKSYQNNISIGRQLTLFRGLERVNGYITQLIFSRNLIEAPKD